MEKEKYKYQKKYAKKNVKKLNIDLNINTDKDVIDFLDTLPNKRQFLLTLIRSYISSHSSSPKQP